MTSGQAPEDGFLGDLAWSPEIGVFPIPYSLFPTAYSHMIEALRDVLFLQDGLVPSINQSSMIHVL